MSEVNNPLGLVGIEFTEYATPDADYMDKVFTDFGFSKLKKFKGKDIVYYNQNDIHFLLNNERDGFSAQFAKDHGPAICSMGWRVENAQKAFEAAVERGANQQPTRQIRFTYPCINGIGDSLIYFIGPFGQKRLFFTPKNFKEPTQPNLGLKNKGLFFPSAPFKQKKVYKRPPWEKRGPKFFKKKVILGFLQKISPPPPHL